MHQGELRLYSLGIVSENKVLDSQVALVVPIEILPMLDGELAVVDNPVINEGVDSFAKEYKVEVNERNSLECTWLQWGSNRKTAPDVRRGERLAIYRYGDSDTFYWVSLGLDDHLRRLETAVYMFSALPDGESDEELTVENSYVLEVSTHSKLITLSTSKANEEPFAYVFQFNTADGVVTITDDVENMFQLESAENRFTMINADLSHFIIDKENIDVFVKDSVTVTAEKTVSFTCNDFFVKASENVGVTCNTLDMAAEGTVSFSAGSTAKIEAGSRVTLDSPLTVCTGAFQSASLAGAGGGTIEMKADVNSSGGGTFAKAVSGPDGAI